MLRFPLPRQPSLSFCGIPERAHTVQQTVGFVGALMDVADEQKRRPSAPANVILAGECEPGWLTRLRAPFGR
jgi:hypothetical protein